MADNYDNYYSSSTYGEDDVKSAGGGEQIDSALYLNEVVAHTKDQLGDQIEQKQNVIVLQPFEPPPNPETGDMWINNNVFPNVIYTWNGTEWIKASATSAEEVGSYTIANVDNLMGTVRTDIEAVDSRTTNVEDFINNGDTLAAKVIETTKYKDDVKTIAKGEVTSAIAELELAQYVTSSELELTATGINNKIKSGNGVNMLRNSVGYADLINWQVTTGTVTIQQGSDLIDAGSGFVMTSGVMKQVVQGLVGQPYTLTAKVRKGTAGTAYMKLSDGNVFQQVDMIATAAYEYTPIQISGFIPDTGVLIVEFGATNATGGAIFTAIMLNFGELGLQWSHAIGEMYNLNAKFDINGLEVKSSVYDGYTRMSPQEFAGYARNNQGVMEKVFTLNKETTEMKQAQLDEFVVIGGTKIVRVEGGGKSGIAFIPN